MRRLINQLTKLPSVGEKSAIRLAYHLLMRDSGEAQTLAQALVEARHLTVLCESCFSLSEQQICEVCASLARDRSLLCVVEKPSDVFAIERSGSFKGLYHVLHGLWSPLRGSGLEHTRIPQLMARLELSRSQSSAGGASAPIQEVVLATSATVEGDATALYLARAISDMGISVSRIAQGLPKGGELEYADDLTLNSAIEGRRRVA